jgi:ectoine hydroxylase-related dioxygenase (phytanoyl-CoA dioxygenase family)
MIGRMDTALAPRTLRRDAPLAVLLDALDCDGAVIVHDMLAPEVVAALRAELGPTEHATDGGPRRADAGVVRFWGGRTKRFTRLAQRSDAFADHVLVHPLLGAVADALLLPHCEQYWMNTGQMMILGPGESAQYLHRDADNWPRMCRPDSPEVTVSCMFALSDFTAEVGATRVVPGSHRWDDYDRVASESAQAVMPPGAGLIYTGRVLHGAGANRTADAWRWGMHLSYVVGWLTPEEAGCLGVSPERARALPARAQQLLGYRCYYEKATAARLWTVDYEDVPVGLGWESP